jgi:hypothetical protein
MEDDDARSSLLHGRKQPQPAVASQPATFYDLQEPSTATKLFQLAFLVIVVLMVAISFILSIYRSAAVPSGMYILLGLGLVGFLAIEVIMIVFVRNGDLPADKRWFLYAVGGCIVIECIFTNIVLFK